MPFQSDKQRKFLYANKPEVARQLAKHPQADAVTKALARHRSRLERGPLTRKGR